MILTNLIAAVVVTLLTNTTETITKYESQRAVPCPQRQNWGGTWFDTYPAQICFEGINPTEKMVVTVVTERSTLSFDWAGKRRELVEDRTISTDAKLITIRHIWTTNVVDAPQAVPVSDATNGLFFMGNSLHITNANIMKIPTNSGAINIRAK